MISSLVGRLERGFPAVWALVALHAIAVILWLNLSLLLGESGLVALLALACASGLVGLAYSVRGQVYGHVRALGGVLDRLGSTQALFVALLVGILLRLVWVAYTLAPFQSDGAVYFDLARRLYFEGKYVDPRGDFAYWPPGIVFFLFAGFHLLGAHTWVPVAGNFLLFALTLYATYKLALSLGSEKTAKIAVVVLACWPNFVFAASLLSKELLVLALVTLMCLAYVKAHERRASGIRGDAINFAGGLAVGFSVLVQPSMLLYPAVLVFDSMFRRVGFRHLLRCFSVIAVGAVLVVGPWAFRNYHVLGHFVSVSTNGGDVFYRANNPLATGGYTARGPIDLHEYDDEVFRSQLGYQLGFEWIRSHPLEFGSLAIQKQAQLMGDDSAGAYENLRRGHNQNSFGYLITKAVSNGFWLGVWVIVLVAWFAKPQQFAGAGPRLALLSLLYLLALHSVFESTGRHHASLYGLLAIVVGLLLARGDHEDTSVLPQRT